MRRAESGVLSVARIIFGRLDSDEYVNAASAIAMMVRIVRRGLRRRFLHTSVANFPICHSAALLGGSGTKFDRTEPRMCVVYRLFAQTEIQRDRAIRLEQVIGRDIAG